MSVLNTDMTISVPFISFTSIRVPPIQFQHYVGTPPRLVTSDLMSGCGGIQLPPALGQIFKMLHDGVAYIDAIANSAINQINSAINSAIGNLNNFIAQTTGSLQAGLQSMLNAINNSGMQAFYDQISHIVNNMPSLASMISSMGSLATSLGMAAGASLNSIFGPIIDGTLNTILSPVLTAMNGITSTIQTAISAGVATIETALSGLTSALNSAVSAVTGAVSAAIAGITGAINAALQNVMHMASAAALSIVCKGASELNSFVNSITSPQLQAALPPPQ